MNYSIYKFSKREWIINYLAITAAFVIVAKLFYGEYKMAVILIPGYFPIFKFRKEQLKENRKKELRFQFKDAIISMADSMNVGYSVENAIRESCKEMEILHGKDSYIYRELIEIVRKIDVNSTVEAAFVDFAKRAGVDDITMFAQIFSVAKRTGGSMVSLICMVANHIGESFRVEREIEVAMSEKRLEQKIMSFVPIGIIIYVSVTSPGFLDVMYETVAGRIIMTISLLGYIGAVWACERILRINM